MFSFENVGAITFGQFAGVLNPGGTLPTVIDPATADDAILVSIAPPGFPLYGANAPNIPFQKLPFQDVPTIVNPAGGIGTLPHNSTVPATVRASGVGKVNYTLGQWLEAEGEIALRCRNNGTTRVRGSFDNLVPNGGIYSMWAFWSPMSTAGPGSKSIFLTAPSTSSKGKCWLLYSLITTRTMASLARFRICRWSRDVARASLLTRT